MIRNLANRQHNGRNGVRLLQFFALLALFVPCAVQAGPGGDGHTHGEDTSSTPTAASPRVAMPGENYDVVAIYKKSRLTFYVDRLSDNSPVVDAELDVTADNVTATAERLPDGTYAATWAKFVSGGVHELVVSIRAKEGDDLVAGTLEISVPETKPPSTVPHSLDRIRDLVGLAGRAVPPWTAVGLAVVFVGGLLGGFLLRALMSRSRSKNVTAIFLMISFVCADWSAAFAGPAGDGHTHGDEQSP